MPRCGFVAIVGRPNAGKSTLLNLLVGDTLAITSPKPQTTRTRVVGIRSVGDSQMIFVDTPGLLEPEYELHRRMHAVAQRALSDADVIVYLADAAHGLPQPIEVIASLDRPPQPPLILALNKTDTITVDAANALAQMAPGAVMLSARTGDGLDALIARIDAALPESQFHYPADELSTHPLRFFAAEFVREAALEQLSDEVPYSIAVVIEEFREDRSPLYIRATVYVERESQKRILIGAKGTRIRELGTASRGRIETLVGAHVYLDLRVKVQPHWRREPQVLDRLGYRFPE